MPFTREQHEQIIKEQHGCQVCGVSAELDAQGNVVFPPLQDHSDNGDHSTIEHAYRVCPDDHLLIHAVAPDGDAMCAQVTADAIKNGHEWLVETAKPFMDQ